MRRKINERPVNLRRSVNMRLYRDEWEIRVPMYIYVDRQHPSCPAGTYRQLAEEDLLGTRME
jgi:hypothetical protein